MHERDKEAAKLWRARWQSWGLVGIGLAIYALLRLLFGPLPQDPSYHLFADNRVCGPIPRAGDVLTNLAILAAGLSGLALWKRVNIAPDERPAYTLLVAGMLFTAFGSAYYHWDPSDARLVWDRLPMTLVMAAIAALVLADRVQPAFARVAWPPFALLGIASVLWWRWSDRFGKDDLWLYLVVHGGVGLLIILLCVFRKGRHSHIGWLVAALALDILMILSERFDHEIFAATNMLVSGHNLKHVLAGALLGCLLMWLVQRKTRSAPAASGGT